MDFVTTTVQIKVKLRVSSSRQALRSKTPTALVFTMVAGCSNSVIFFQVI